MRRKPRNMTSSGTIGSASERMTRSAGVGQHCSRLPAFDGGVGRGGGAGRGSLIARPVLFTRAMPAILHAPRPRAAYLPEAAPRAPDPSRSVGQHLLRQVKYEPVVVCPVISEQLALLMHFAAHSLFPLQSFESTLPLPLSKPHCFNLSTASSQSLLPQPTIENASTSAKNKVFIVSPP